MHPKELAWLWPSHQDRRDFPRRLRLLRSPKCSKDTRGPGFWRDHCAHRVIPAAKAEGHFLSGNEFGKQPLDIRLMAAAQFPVDFNAVLKMRKTAVRVSDG